MKRINTDGPHQPGMEHCEMKGFLAFSILTMIARQEMSGDCIRKALEQKRGTMPSAGTIYPVLKDLREGGFIEECENEGRNKYYRITEKGKAEAEAATRRFVTMFADLKDEFEKA